MFHSSFPLSVGFIEVLQHWDSSWRIHPILVNFTAALVPVSIFSDLAGRLFRRESLLTVGWWTMLYAGLITPFTAMFGWLFWMPDDNGVKGMAIHKWLGTSLAALLIMLLVWRITIHRKKQSPGVAYLLVGICFVAALIYQGMLGGDQTFSGM
ncbi:MAG TPA: DUF2231 domain-containing protein [Tepidisphaeraceae bacterium]|nr:DUF2231 domain-containing protein [Tepidisphaeraceae bacterium]